MDIPAFVFIFNPTVYELLLRKAASSLYAVYPSGMEMSIADDVDVSCVIHRIPAPSASTYASSIALYLAVSHTPAGMLDIMAMPE